MLQHNVTLDDKYTLASGRAYMTGIVSGLWGYPFGVGFLSGLAAAIAMGLLFLGGVSVRLV